MLSLNSFLECQMYHSHSFVVPGYGMCCKVLCWVVYTSVRRLIHLNCPVLLRQLHHHSDGERTGHFGRAGKRRICLEVQGVESIHVTPWRW